MKAILMFDMPYDCEECPLYDEVLMRCHYLRNERYGVDSRLPECPLIHPLKYVSNDFYIYDTKYLMQNLDREIKLLKGVKDFESNIDN